MDETPTTEAAWAKCPTPDACRASGQEHPCLACWDEAGDIVAGLRLEELMSGQSQTAALRSEPEADWNAVWSAMQELGAAMAPLMDLASPPSWAVTMRFAMDVALPDIEEHCAEAESDD